MFMDTVQVVEKNGRGISRSAGINITEMGDACVIWLEGGDVHKIALDAKMCRSLARKLIAISHRLEDAGCLPVEQHAME